MFRIIPVFLIMILVQVTGSIAWAQQEKSDDQKAQQAVESLDKPLYSAFIERYVLDELKQLRTEMAAQKHELMQQILDREHSSVDRAVTYTTDAVTYFFYLIAGATSLLVLAGWSSIRDMKERMQSIADEEVSKLIAEYENRLFAIEQQLKKEAESTNRNREQIELTRDIQSLWLKAGQDSNPTNKIAIYDEILKLRSDDCEALTYKADAVLDLGEARWAVSLCQQALKIDPENGHALYQIACAYADMEQYDEALSYITQAIELQDSYREEATIEPKLQVIKDLPAFQELVRHNADI